MAQTEIVKIQALTPIDGADRIELAHVLGWQCIVKKGQFRVGDLAIYVNIDSKVPQTEYFEFMAAKSYRVKTMKMRGVISQGLLLPTKEFQCETAREGASVDDKVGVTRYSKEDNDPRDSGGSRDNRYRKPFPHHIVSRTDEVRVQNVSRMAQSKGVWWASYKMDGSSITLIHQRKWWFWHKIRICSRNFELVKDDGNQFHSAVRNSKMEDVVLSLVKHFKTDRIVVQGEAVGPNFNGNWHGLHESKILLFNIFVNGIRLAPENFYRVCKELNIPHCPLYKIYNQGLDGVDKCLQDAQIPDYFDPTKPGEGLVFRSADGLMSFKAVNNEYLLLKGE
jgi:RNA ligase (TIGR02306 family)